MNQQIPDNSPGGDPPRGPRDKKSTDVPQREGGDDALNADPDDSRLDEKVIVNEQRSDQIVNTPPQTDPFAGDGEKLE
jgi:hypothetical protein